MRRPSPEDPSRNGSANGVFAQRFDMYGNPIAQEFQVNSFTTNNRWFPSVGVSPDGNYVIAWESLYQDASLFGIFAAQSLAANLSLTKTAEPEHVSAGEEVTYAITVANAGPDDATNVTITDVLPEGMSYVSGSASQGSGCTELSGTVTCDLGTVAKGADATATIVVETLLIGTFENSATATSDQVDADGAASTAPAVSAAGSDIPAVNPLGLVGWTLMKR